MGSAMNEKASAQVEELGTRLLMLKDKMESAGRDDRSTQVMLQVLDRCIGDAITAYQSGDASCLTLHVADWDPAAKDVGMAGEDAAIAELPAGDAEAATKSRNWMRLLRCRCTAGEASHSAH